MAGLVKRGVKRTGKTLSDWLGMQLMVGLFVFVKDIFVAVFMPWKREATGRQETFEEAVQRLGLTEEDLEQRKRMFLQQTLLFFALGLAVVLYGVKMAFDHSLMTMIICFVVSLVAFANAFRSHFWFFQTKRRKLGCTLQEWLNAGLGG